MHEKLELIIRPEGDSYFTMLAHQLGTRTLSPRTQIERLRYHAEHAAHEFISDEYRRAPNQRAFKDKLLFNPDWRSQEGFTTYHGELSYLAAARAEHAIKDAGRRAPIYKCVIVDEYEVPNPPNRNPLLAWATPYTEHRIGVLVSNQILPLIDALDVWLLKHQSREHVRLVCNVKKHRKRLLQMTQRADTAVYEKLRPLGA